MSDLPILKRKADDIIEQQQARIAELKQREAELEKANEKLLENSRNDLGKIQALKKLNDELAATVETLTSKLERAVHHACEGAANNFHISGEDYCEVDEIRGFVNNIPTPPTNLNAVKWGLVINFADHLVSKFQSGMSGGDVYAESERYIKQHYPDKEKAND